MCPQVSACKENLQDQSDVTEDTLSPSENNDSEDRCDKENNIPVKMSKDWHFFEGCHRIDHGFMHRRAIYPIAKICDIEQKGAISED